MWKSFLSLDIFTKTVLVAFLLFAIATPYIISKRFNTIQQASQSGLVTFVDTNNTAITQTTTPDVRLQLAPPDGWTLAQTPKTSIFAKTDIVPNVHAQAPAVPGAPGTPTAEAGDTQATVSWTAPSSDGGSVIYRYYVGFSNIHSTAGGVNVNCPCSTLSKTVTGLTNGDSYYFTVQAVNAVGPGPQSSNSNSVIPTPPDNFCPIAPPTVSATAGCTADNAYVDLSWNAMPGATSYTIWREDLTDSFGAIGSTTSSLSYRDTNGGGAGTVQGNTRYEYRVAANAIRCSSTQSLPASITTSACSTQTTPTLTPTPTTVTFPTSTPRPTDTPIPTPTVKNLFKITIQNTDNGSGGDTLRTIDKQEIIAALNAPITWKINTLNPTESSAIRTVQVIYFAHTDAGDTQTAVATSITLVASPTPTLSPSPTSEPQLTNTPTPIISVTPTVTTIPSQTPTTTLAPTRTTTPSPTGVILPTNTPTTAVSPTRTPTRVPVIGDANGDNCVSNADLNIIVAAVTSQIVQPGTTTDLNNDGNIDIADINVWFGATRLGTNACN